VQKKKEREGRWGEEERDREATVIEQKSERGHRSLGAAVAGCRGALGAHGMKKPRLREREGSRWSDLLGGKCVEQIVSPLLVFQAPALHFEDWFS
jgi:hypothetical protein